MEPQVKDPPKTAITKDDLFAGMAQTIKDTLKELKPPDPEPDPKAEAEQKAMAELRQGLAKAATDGHVIEPDGKGGYKRVEPSEIVDRAMMGQALTAGIERGLNTVIPNVPVGSIAVGGGTGFLATELIDGFVDRLNFADDGSQSVNPANILAKGVALAVVGAAGGQVMTKMAQNIAMGVIGLDILRQVFPLDDLIQNLRNALNRNGNGAGSALRQAERVARAAQERAGMGVLPFGEDRFGSMI